MFRRLATSSLALIAMAAPALSEITPAEVWDQMIAENGDVGITVTEGSREEAGDTLTLTDVVFTNEAATSTTTFTMPKIVLNQTGDGNVRWTLEGDITGTATQKVPTGEGEGEEEIEVPFTISMPGNETVSSGSVEDLSHEYKADTVTVSVDFAVEDGVSIPLTVNLNGLQGSQRSVAEGAAGGREIDADFTIQSLTASVKGELPESGTETGTEAEAGAEGGAEGGVSGDLNLEYTMNNVTGSGNFLLPGETFDLNSQMEEALRAGMEMVFDLTFADLDGSFTFASKDEAGVESTSEGTMTAGPSTLKFGMSDEGLVYSGSAEASENSMTSSTLPFPIRYTINSASFDVAVPVLPSEESAPFKLATSLSGFSVNDEVWAMFDPETKLPRDPADLNIDVTGEIQVKQSFLNPEIDPNATEMPDPFAPTKVTVNDVSLKVVGAEAKLKGELAAPEGGDMTVAPVGTISGEFTGVETLLGTLGAMGLVPEEQMMGVRMMLSMFARPVEGEPGKLTTEFEFREDGSIFANGQQVK